jgi:DNA-binding MarR family transcriptional regulator
MRVVNGLAAATRVSGNERPRRRPIDKPTVDRVIDYGPLAGWIGFHLRLAQNGSFQAFAREAEGADLRPGRFATLLLIERNPGISQTALSRANARDKSTLTPMIEDLVRRKLVRRTRSWNDRRSYRLTLTAAGRTMLARLSESAERHERKLDRIIGVRDRARFLAILKRIVSGLDRNGKSNGTRR